MSPSPAAPPASSVWGGEGPSSPAGNPSPAWRLPGLSSEKPRQWPITPVVPLWAVRFLNLIKPSGNFRVPSLSNIADSTPLGSLILLFGNTEPHQLPWPLSTNLEENNRSLHDSLLWSQLHDLLCGQPQLWAKEKPGQEFPKPGLILSLLTPLGVQAF